MSARDAESGSSTYKGGSGRAGGLGNGGIGGGMGGGGNHGGGMGGGAGRNGGIGSRTGLTTGNRMIGGTAFGRPGGPAMNPGAWGIAPTPRIAQGPLSGVPRRPGVPAPAALPGVNPVPEYVPQLPNMWYPPQQQMPHWGTWMDNSTAYGFGYDAKTSPPAAAPHWGTWADNSTTYGRGYDVKTSPGYNSPSYDPSPAPELGGRTSFQGNNFNGNKGYY